jgi:Baseplate J-like protein
MAASTLRYIQVDYLSHKNALLQRVRARYPSVWNDFLLNSFGIVLIDIMAWSTATVAYLINRAAGENFINTMTLRESAVNIGSLIGYQLAGPMPATVACEAAIAQPQAVGTLTIAQGTVVRSTASGGTSPLPFEVSQNYFILQGNTTPITTIVTISAAISGPQVLSTYVLVTPGSANADLLNTTIDMTQYVQPGQIFQVSGDPNTYVIVDIQASPGAISNNRLVLAKPYVGTQPAAVAAQVYDQRILLVQGLTVEDDFTSPPNVTPSYVLQLSTTPVIQGSVSVVVNGVTWNSQTSFAKSIPTSTDYVFQTTPSGQPLVIFGDGTFGAAIPTGATITITYRVGGGVAGNVPLNSFNTSITGILSTTSTPLTIQITNVTGVGSGGQDPETLEQARLNIPAATRANNRAVTLEDYQTMATSFPGVTFARAVVRTENSFLEGNIVFIYPWTTGPNGTLINLTPLQQVNLQTFMQTVALGTDLVEIGNGTATPLPISLRFKVLSGFDITQTGLEIQSTLLTFADQLVPGQSVIYSYLFSAIDDTLGVDTLTLATPTGDLIPSNSLELFTPPDSTFSYSLTKNGAGNPIFSVVDNVNVSLYTSQMPVYPIQAWSFNLLLGINPLTIVPGINPGFALVIGPGLSADVVNFPSTVNLLTGQISLYIIGAPGDLSMTLNTSVGYSTDKYVNIYIGYSGNTSQFTRRQVRSAIQAWGTGLAVGASMYAQTVPGIIGSVSNITAVAAAIPGVTAVNRVALDTPGNPTPALTTVETTLLRVGNVILNNEID